MLAQGTCISDARASLAERLAALDCGLSAVVRDWCPQQAAVEKAVMGKNARASLLLGQARGVVLLVPARQGIPVAEYFPTQVKKAVVGSGRADKVQIAFMLSRLLPGASACAGDSSDALAVALCHALNAHPGTSPDAGSGDQP